MLSLLAKNFRRANFHHRWDAPDHWHDRGPQGDRAHERAAAAQDRRLYEARYF
jgi:hypothetical protein